MLQSEKVKSLEPGAIYRHYKGKCVMVMGLADYLDLGHISEIKHYKQMFFSYDTHKPKECGWIVDRDGRLFYAWEEEKRSPVVVYACSGKIWHRPKQEFLDKFDNVSGLYL